MHTEMDGRQWYLVCTCNPQAPVSGCIFAANEPTDEEVKECEQRREPADKAHQAYLDNR